MLITPRPGADRKYIRRLLAKAHTNALNLRLPEANAYKRLLRYLNWATDTASVLRSQVSAKDIDTLVFTSRYRVLLANCGTLAGTAQERLVNGLVNLEFTERVQAFEEAQAALDAQIGRWNGPEWFVVADSSFYIRNPIKLADVDLHKVLGFPSGEHIWLLFPMVVVDELDALKEGGKQQARLRAPHTLGLLDRFQRAPSPGRPRGDDPVPVTDVHRPVPHRPLVGAAHLGLVEGVDLHAGAAVEGGPVGSGRRSRDAPCGRPARSRHGSFATACGPR